MDVKIPCPTQRKKWFRTALPGNLALACFSLALCQAPGEAKATDYNVGTSGGSATVKSLFSTVGTFNDSDTITLFRDDSSPNMTVITMAANDATLTIRSNDSTIRTITQGEPNTTIDPDTGEVIVLHSEMGGLFRGANESDTRLVLQNLTLTGSIAQGSAEINGLNAGYAGLGGAIMSDGALVITRGVPTSEEENLSKNVTFSNNQAIGGAVSGVDSSTSWSGLGGALYGASVLIEGAETITFEGNRAIGGNAAGGGNSEFSGIGGAIASESTMEINNSRNILFVDNQAIGGDSTGDLTTGSSSAVSGWGGAIYATEVQINGVDGIIFENNQAIGGTATGSANVAASGLGGAIASESLSITDSQNVLFIGNQAIGGTYEKTTTPTTEEAGTYIQYYGYSGLGGAIYSGGGALTLENVVFLNNNASTTDKGDYSSGRGGAIFVDAADQTVNIDAVNGGMTIFHGNTQNQAGSKDAQANSIYFGTTSVQDTEVTAGTITANFHADAGSYILMFDPMASQADNLITRPDDKDNQHQMTNLELEINKTGKGTWALAGHNDMQSATIWTVEEGTLHLGDLQQTAAHIELGHKTTASFTLADGATISLDPLSTGHTISAKDITLEEGSVVALNTADLLYAPGLNVGTGHREILVLNTDNPANLNNKSEIDGSSGGFYRNAYDYSYDNLQWSSDGSTLSADFRTRLNPARGAISATTAPTAIIVHQPFSGTLIRHMDRLFRNVPKYDTRKRRYVDSGSGSGSGLDGMFSSSRDGSQLMASFTPGAGSKNTRRHSTPNNLWLTSGYSSTSQNGTSDYDLKTGSATVGYDRWVEDSLFVGAAFSYAQPDYDSPLADVKADSLYGAIYGGGVVSGGLEISAFVSYGMNDHDQTRRVEQFRYDSDYDSTVWSGGLGVAYPVHLDQGLTLRPFINYEYIFASIDGYREGSSSAELDAYALDVDSREDSLNRVEAGLGLDWQNEQGVFFSSRAYYQGLYGDTESEAAAYFINDPLKNGFTSVGDEMDEHSFGLGLRFGVSIMDGMDASLGYNLLTGDNSTTHQGNINLLWRF